MALAAGLSVVFLGPVRAEKIAVIGGKVVTMGDAGTLERGTVLIEDHRIVAVGADLQVPDGYRTIDASGQWVTPGLMQAESRIGVEEVELESSTTDHSINTGGTFSGESATAPFFAAFDISYGINPNTPLIEISRIEGLTRAAVLPGQGLSVFAGQGALIHLGDGMDIVTNPRAAVVAYLGESGADATGGARGAAMVYLRAALDEAARFARDGASSLPARERDSILPRLDIEALAPVVRGDVPLVLAVSRASDILQVLALMTDFPDLRPVVLGAEEGWMVAGEMAAAGLPAIIDPMQNLPVTFSEIGATLRNAARMSEAGVLVALVGGAPDSRTHNARLLPQAAGVAVAHGMDWDAAMAAITLNPARIFGIDGHFGSLEAGKDADVVVWDGDPLEVMSSPTAVLVRGEQVPLVSRQTRLRDRYLDLADDEDRHAYRK
jgi:imidazolonepropionase-like amidohydrolase